MEGRPWAGEERCREGGMEREVERAGGKQPI